MRQKLLIGFLSFVFVMNIAHSGFCDIETLQGELLRSYDKQAGEWNSSILIKDIDGKRQQIFVHDAGTLVERDSQIQSLNDLTGGMKVTILYRKMDGKLKASLVRIDGGFHG